MADFTFRSGLLTSVEVKTSAEGLQSARFTIDVGRGCVPTHAVSFDPRHIAAIKAAALRGEAVKIVSQLEDAA